MAVTNSVFNAKSRYTQGGETEVYDDRLGWWERDLDTFRENANDNFIRLSADYDRRPDKFAADYLGRSDLMWSILQFNSIVDINEEFVAGRTIRVPTPDRATFDFFNKRTGGIPPRNG